MALNAFKRCLYIGGDSQGLLLCRHGIPHKKNEKLNALTLSALPTKIRNPEKIA
jgi:hypothetical protein